MDHILENITDKYSIKPEDIGPWHNPKPDEKPTKVRDFEKEKVERRKEQVLKNEPPKMKVKYKNPFATRHSPNTMSGMLSARSTTSIESGGDYPVDLFRMKGIESV